jgi:cytochrome c oxidase cbb3-type subunit 2
MNQGPLLFLGAFFTLSVSWLGFVLSPQLQIGGQQQVELRSTGAMYPPMRPGLARQGEQVYRANGCFYCHSEQVRPRGLGADVERGWGARTGNVQSVDQDYLYDRPAMLGNQRVGPDLANIGLRQTNTTVLLSHLYNPQITMPGSVMPPYRFLFVKRKLVLGEKPSDDALQLGDKAEPGYEILPTDDALALAAYLTSLHSDSVLFEAPPKKIPPKPGAATNAPAAAAPPTNSPPK